MKKFLLLTIALGALTLTACGQKPAETRVPQTVEVTNPESKPGENGANTGNRPHVIAALGHPDRPAKDRTDDIARKPGAVLRFSGIMPGQSVIEIEAGSGYYTELLSRLVGKNGQVITQNPKAFDTFFKPEEIDARFGADGTRLANIRRTKTRFDSLEAPDAGADVVTWFLGPHELFFMPHDGSYLGDPDTAYAEIFRVLKPGGKFIVLDHVAAAGAPESTGGDTHRIDPASVRARAEAAGFRFRKQSRVLANVADNYETNVFDPGVRRQTDRFLHMYVKPE